MKPETCVIANTKTRSKKSSSAVTRWADSAAASATVTCAVAFTTAEWRIGAARSRSRRPI
jgi:hypothetical protein